MRGTPQTAFSRRSLSGEAGVTIVEVVVAALVLAVGSLAVLGLVDGASRASFRAEQSQSVNDALQREVEKLKAIPYANLGMTSTPSGSTDTASPANRVSGAGYYVDRAKTDLAPMVIDGGALAGGGTVAGGQIGSAALPQTQSFALGDVKGTLYRYVVWRDDPTCSPADCPGTQDAKRAIVALKLDSTASGGTRLYQEASSDVTNPVVNAGAGIDPPEGGIDFWTTHLTDTPCNRTTYQPVSAANGGHTVHNTLGSCENSSGSFTDSLLKTLLGDLYILRPALQPEVPQQPDLMFPDAQYPGTNPATAPLINYSNNVTPNDAAQKGLTMPTPNGSLANLGCLGGTVSGFTGPAPIATVTRLAGVVVGTTLPSTLLSPLVGSAPETRVHKWVTPKLSTALSLLSVGTGRLNLWTRTVNGSIHPGKICIWIFQRSLNADGIPVDVPLVNLGSPGGLAYTSYASQGNWPTSWTKIQVPLNVQLDLATLPVKSRIGVAIAVDKAGTTPGTGLQFMYDHPNYDSSLQLNISNTLPSLCVGTALPPICTS